MRRVSGSCALWHAGDAAGRRLSRRGDGRLAMLAAGDPVGIELVFFRDETLGPCLAEAPGRLIRLGDAEAAAVLALLVVPSGAQTCLRDAAGHSLVLAADGAVMYGDAGGDAVCVSFTPAHDVPTTSLLARLPGSTLDLEQIIATGAPEMVPVAEAVLQLVDVRAARHAWTAQTRNTAQDLYHPALRAQAHRVLGRFPAYTADLLADEIARYGWSIGAHTYGAPRILEAGRGSILSVGRFSSMAEPTIVLGNHKTRGAASYPFMDLWSEWPGTIVGATDHEAKDVRIGNDVWIGVGSILLPGCDIGDGAVVGAGSVVRGRIPAYGVCIGNPAVVRNYRFDPATIGRLLAIRWWDWPDGKIDRFIPLLLDADIDAFLAAAEAEHAMVPA